MSPDYVEVTNWVPQDTAHPLYVPEHADLLREILFDYMIQEEVKPDDPRMSQPNGLQVTNLNGKTLNFTRDASGETHAHARAHTRTHIRLYILVPFIKLSYLFTAVKIIIRLSVNVITAVIIIVIFVFTIISCFSDAHLLLLTFIYDFI